jgi:hypothetical protein
MTTILVLLAVLVLVDLVTGVVTWRRNRPASAPRSHRDWVAGLLPSKPYVLRR